MVGADPGGLAAPDAQVSAPRRKLFGRRAGGAGEAMDALATGVEIATGLRDGLTAPAASGAARRLRALLDADAVGLVDLYGARTWAGRVVADAALVDEALRTDRRAIRGDIAALPLRVRDEPAGVLVVAGPVSDTAAAQGSRVAVADALHRGRLEASAEAAEQAELRALRAEISPHFVYNASPRSPRSCAPTPDRARELMLDFALYIRHNLARHGEYTTLAGEFRAIEAYLALARAVLGERLRVQVRIAPEVLPVAMPFLALQPLVENAVQHGVERTEGGGSVQVSGEAQGERLRDRGGGRRAGHAPRARRATCWPGAAAGPSLGLVNVDRRLRAVFGAGYGLVIETAPDAGTRVVRAGAAVPPGRGGLMTAGSGLRVPGRGRRRARPSTRCASCCARRPGSRSVEAAADAFTALRLIQATTPDAVFLDISMPGMDGLELAGLLGRMTDPPAIVFVTAFEQHAVVGLRRGRRRLPAQAGLGRAARRRAGPGAPGRRSAGAGPGARRRRAGRGAGRAGRAHPVRAPRRRPLRRGAGRLRPPAHPRRRGTWCASRSPGSRSTGAESATSGCTAATCWPCARCRSCAAT